MELKLKRREVRVDVYGEKQTLRYPKVHEHREYIGKVLKEDADEYALTKEFLIMLGMDEKAFKELEQPDMQEMILILTGQKKI